MINNFVTGLLLSNVYEYLGRKSFSLVNIAAKLTVILNNDKCLPRMWIQDHMIFSASNAKQLDSFSVVEVSKLKSSFPLLYDQCINNDGDHDNLDDDHGDCRQDILWRESDKDWKRALDSSSIVELRDWQWSLMTDKALFNSCVISMILMLIMTWCCCRFFHEIDASPRIWNSA